MTPHGTGIVARDRGVPRRWVQAPPTGAGLVPGPAWPGVAGPQDLWAPPQTPAGEDPKTSRMFGERWGLYKNPDRPPGYCLAA